MKSLIVVDCQYDFIDGSLGCENSEEAVGNIIRYINENDVEVHYSMDWHRSSNESFSVNGGIWPVHCVQGERGAQLHHDFSKAIIDPSKKPNVENTYYKGMDDQVEEYSAYNARNRSGLLLREALGREVIVAGIASEYCVRETVLALLKDGYKVSVMEDGLGYVNRSDHLENLEELKSKQVSLISSK